MEEEETLKRLRASKKVVDLVGLIEGPADLFGFKTGPEFYSAITRCCESDPEEFYQLVETCAERWGIRRQSPEEQRKRSIDYLASYAIYGDHGESQGIPSHTILRNIYSKEDNYGPAMRALSDYIGFSGPELAEHLYPIPTRETIEAQRVTLLGLAAGYGEATESFHKEVSKTRESLRD